MATTPAGPPGGRPLAVLGVALVVAVPALVPAAPATASVTAAAVAAVRAAAPVTTAAAVRAAVPSPGPTPVFVLPPASSTIGGDRLRGPGVLADLAPGTPAAPRPAAAAWLVADLDTGDVLLAGNAHVPLGPASTLKILTALALVPRLDPQALYTAVDADAAVDGTKVGLVPRSRYTVADLEHGLLMGSGNDTANALARLSGGMAAATASMAEQASRLQACDTVPVNDSGLDAVGQTSSAYDLALLGRAALAQPRIAALLRTTAYSFPAAGVGFDAGRKRYQIQNHNRLLRNYAGATGVKNGFTDAVRGTFVGSATRGGRSYVVTLMRTEGRNWHDAAALLDWAFAQGTRARPVGRLADPLPDGTATGCPAGTPAGDRAGAVAAPYPGASGSSVGAASSAGSTPVGGAAGTVASGPDRRPAPAGYAGLRGPASVAAGIVALCGVVLLVARRRRGARPRTGRASHL